LLDADLAILASPPARYTQYVQAVRLEYAHLDDASWREGRRAWVQRFLARPRIYWTERFYLEGETLARQNLQTECE
jgi:predicted metal-dependent HD superfamily phosphohydrolase